MLLILLSLAMVVVGLPQGMHCATQERNGKSIRLYVSVHSMSEPQQFGFSVHGDVTVPLCLGNGVMLRDDTGHIMLRHPQLCFVEQLRKYELANLNMNWDEDGLLVNISVPWTRATRSTRFTKELCKEKVMRKEAFEHETGFRYLDEL
eukprot:NODE_5794_length_610_cov_23.824017_g5630_i0.p2 GENE.NODE_5794_length_610_cov_23.824017_g5630_i0~~NODE_5794_length_610_cov_23.824017_g5630_i0.p2  ORF type:complete len:148 (-),score=41.07 NODE_5794_length_610_cov_23.824017_g5630_i0:103-546(-)